MSETPHISRSMSHRKEAEDYYIDFVSDIQLKEGDTVLKNWFYCRDGRMIADYIVVENGKVIHQSLSDTVDNVKRKYVWTYQSCPMHFH